MRKVLRSGLFVPCCLVACSATPLDPGPGEVGYRLDWIEPPAGVLAVAAAGINDRGQIVGGALGPSGPDAFTWSPEQGYVTLARFPTADFMSAYAINDSGVIVGLAEWQDGTSRPVIWNDPAQAQDLGVSGYAYRINDLGHVVGTQAPQGIGVAYIWDATNGATSLGTLGGSWSVAYGVNAADEVVGTSELADGTSHAFLWSPGPGGLGSDGTMIDLGALDGVYSEGYAISDAGVVTGTYQGPAPADQIRVFRWTRAEGMVDVGPTYVDATDNATSLSTDVNDRGQIVGGVRPIGPMIRAAVRQPASGAWQELTPEMPFESFALGVNGLGVIVGHVATSADPDEPTRAAVWTPGGSVVGAGSP